MLWGLYARADQEEDYGRARVMAQWADDAEYITEAIDLCPVDCIHYVPRDQLALLEFVMKSCKRENAAILARRWAAVACPCTVLCLACPSENTHLSEIKPSPMHRGCCHEHCHCCCPAPGKAFGGFVTALNLSTRFSQA